MGGPGAGRYAPSPTGELHIGNLRTAVLAWLFARSSSRELLLRIEDLDTGRVRPGVARRQIADLAALGITFDGVPVVQSERTSAYAVAVSSLAERTFECFCTRRDIADAASAPHDQLASVRSADAPGVITGSGAVLEYRRYPGTCRNLTAAQRAERRAVRAPALRLRAEQATMTITDELHGRLTGPVDDIVLRRNDGGYAYNLAVVIDDAASGIDQVVRGDDLLGSAISQAYLGTLLGGPAPTYAHVPLALNRQGRRLAKRDGAVTLTDLAAQGIGPTAVLGAIAVSLELASPGEPVTLPLLLERFAVQRLPREPWIVDPSAAGRASRSADGGRGELGC
ncbi:MAG TPA: tRNA glutamyl-Q(34) synthetase GluQRS [Microlunatus sp.]|nr:tRNA glutamyl-Q(34) synthetase GluQRS [Microlunatus sp.]